MASNKQWAAVFGISALLGLGLGGIAYATQPVPELQQVTVAQAAPPVEVGDPNDLLTPEQERSLIDTTVNLQVPGTVTDIQYLVFAENHEEPLDDVENWLRDNAPDLIDQTKGENGNTYANVNAWHTANVEAAAAASSSSSSGFSAAGGSSGF